MLFLYFSPRDVLHYIVAQLNWRKMGLFISFETNNADKPVKEEINHGEVMENLWKFPLVAKWVTLQTVYI